MEPYIVLLGIGCVVNAFCAGIIGSRDRQRPEGRINATVHVGAAWWAFCEIAWNLAPDAPTALVWMRASAPGWVFVGPLVLHSFVSLEGGPTRLRRAIPILYLASAGFLLLTWTTPWMMAGAVPTSWGHGYRVGPAYVAFYAVTLAAVGAAYTLLGSLLGSATHEADRRQRPFVVAGMLIPLSVASTTDVLLPIFDVQVLRLGTLSFAVLAVLTVSNVIRFGYSLILPGNFSDEILETLTDGFALLHPNGRIRTANEGLVRLTGRSRAALERMDIGEVLGCDLETLHAGPRELEGEIATARGERRPVALTSRMVRDRRSNALGLVVTVRDLREVESLRTRLATSDRLAAVGELAAGIAHEINNPLAFVRANLSQLEGQWKRLRMALGDGTRALEPTVDRLLEDTDEMIEESLEGVDRAAEIIRGVRSFSHAGSGSREPADLEELIDQALVMAGPRLRGRIEVERRYASLPPVVCAQQQMKQVFLNLVVNAAQAIGDRGRLRVSTRTHPDGVQVDVEDDGPGVPEALRARIFDPFFTTKPVGEGTGLGLGIVHQIVRSHGGHIEADDAPLGGARFRVTLPRD